MELNYYSTPESLDWRSIAKASLYSYQELQQIKDDFPDIRAHFPILEMSCSGKERVNWSNFYIKEFVGTIDRLEDNLNSLEDLLIKNIVWIRDQPIATGSVNDLDDQLIKDGRIHPARIEESVEKARTEVDETVRKAGQKAMFDADVKGLHPELVKLIGRLKFRYSYGENVLQHSVEVGLVAGILAAQIGANPQIAKTAGFLHDIGKAMDHEVEGTHPQIGMDFCKKYGEKAEAVLNAIAGHHGDIPSTTPYTPIVMAADAISSARPGARRESMEMYVKRLEQLESLAKEQPGVTESFAIQAGREVRVIVDAKSISDGEAFAISKRIATRIEEEMTFPGEIKVTVLREVRAEATAR